MSPSETEIIAANIEKFSRPCSAAVFDITAMPTMDVEFDTVSAAVAGLNSPRMATSTMPM